MGQSVLSGANLRKKIKPDAVGIKHLVVIETKKAARRIPDSSGNMAVAPIYFLVSR
jgi:hypothetical protein